MAPIAVSPKVYSRKFGDEVVLLDFARGEYFGLDVIGARVWQGLETGEALEAIAAQISAEYACSAEQAFADILALVAQLEAQSLISR